MLHNPDEDIRDVLCLHRSSSDLAAFQYLQVRQLSCSTQTTCISAAARLKSGAQSLLSAPETRSIQRDVLHLNLTPISPYLGLNSDSAIKAPPGLQTTPTPSTGTNTTLAQVLADLMLFLINTVAFNYKYPQPSLSQRGGHPRSGRAVFALWDLCLLGSFN